jgi:hypothetical protein
MVAAKIARIQLAISGRPPTRQVQAIPMPGYKKKRGVKIKPAGYSWRFPFPRLHRNKRGIKLIPKTQRLRE